MYIFFALVLSISTPEPQAEANSQTHVHINYRAGKETVTGTVTDDNGPIQGASVRIKGTTAGAQTDEKGSFKLETDENTITLVVSAPGYKSKEIVVHPGAPVTLRLEKEGRL